MDEQPRAAVRTDRIAVGILLAWAVALWLPALWTPFWGDDYVYLYGARAANVAGEPWLKTFWPDQPLQFWRPLSQEAWWRVIELLGADAKASHLAMLALQILASAGVAVLGWVLACVCGWARPAGVGLLAGTLYAVSAVSLLPVHWVAAANSPILVVFTALLLAAWLAVFQVAGGKRLVLLAAVPVLMALGLLSKESAILMPVLMGLTALFVGRRPQRGQVLVLIACAAMGVIWLLLRKHITLPPAPQYAYAFGGNLLRNAASMVAWLLNVPREALRMIATADLKVGVAWAGAVALLAGAAWVLALRGGLSRLTPMQWRVLLAFPVLAYAPYFPLIWNSYAYYAAIAAMLPAIVLARLLQGRRRLVIAAFLLGLSAWVSVAGTRWLDHPGLIGRARWAEITFEQLSQKPVVAPLWLKVEDDQRFYAMGAHGLAWRLGLRLEDIRAVEQCPQAPGTCLDIRADGTWTRGSATPVP